MDWKRAAEDAVEDIKEDGVIGGTKDLREEYRIDQKELGKIMFISSLALLVTSAPAALTLQDTYSTVESANNDLNQVQSIISSDGFQRNLQVLNERVSGDLGSTIEQISSGMERTNTSLQRLESTETKLEEQANTYRWMSLISIMGMVAGIVTIYI